MKFIQNEELGGPTTVTSQPEPEVAAPRRPRLKRFDCDHKPFNPSEEQKANLLKLADFLWFTPPGESHFDMSLWCDHTQCGSVACAVGWFAIISGHVSEEEGGFFPTFNGRELEWDSYRRRALGIPDEAHQWISHSSWAHFDRTPRGAAKRIYYALEYGLPGHGFYSPELA